jgi:2-polyprenyl-3-methyl-5-hydroxy-6-metoxy-1,4-benzoquinol methylase
MTDRLWKGFAFPSVGAWNVLRLLPRRTGDRRRFARPAELASAASHSGFAGAGRRGIRCVALLHRAAQARDVSVNRIATVARAGGVDGLRPQSVEDPERSTGRADRRRRTCES